MLLMHLLADPVSHSVKLMEAFETLSKRLRLLDDIPLKVSTVQPLDPGIFYSSDVLDFITSLVTPKYNLCKSR
jgi:Nrap protein nucleotidyltransferase domain 4